MGGILLIQHYFTHTLINSKVQQYLDIVTSGKVNTAMARVTVGTGTMSLKHIKEEGNLKAYFRKWRIPKLLLEKPTPRREQSI